MSYSKLRAISRVATAETEETLVELARHATASQMEQIARACREVKRQITKDKNGKGSKEHRYLRWYWDEDGYLVIAGRFPPEEGAIFMRHSTPPELRRPRMLTRISQLVTIPRKRRPAFLMTTS